MTYTYEDLTLTLIENTIMQKMIGDGTHQAYVIKPIDGYVLHDNALDFSILDEDDIEKEEIVLGYTTGTCTCAASYDFTENSREFYAILKTSVDENQIF